MLERIVSLLEGILAALQSQNTFGKQEFAKAQANVGLAHSEGASKASIPAPAPPQAQMSAPAPAFGNAAATDFLAPAPPAAIAPPTREAVGNALIELATISRDKAVEVLAAFGGAQKLSQVPESEYPTLLLNINKTRAGLA